MRPLFLLAAVAACQPAAPPPDRATIEQEIIQARDRVWRAWFEGDSAGLAQALPAAMVGMGETTGQIIANAISFRADGNRLVGVSFTDSEFMLTDSMAVVVSNYRVETMRNDTTSVRRGRATEVFIRVDGRWVNPYWTLNDAPEGAVP